MNNKTKKKLLDRAIELKALEYGDFTLASGMKSNFYFDGRLLSLDPICSNIITDWIFSNAIEQKVNSKNPRIFFPNRSIYVVVFDVFCNIQ